MRRLTSRLPCAVIALLLVVSPGCMSTAPRVVVQGAHGFVRADSPAQAQIVSALLETMVPRVRAILPDTLSEPVEVWVQRELSLYTHWSVNKDVPAFTVERERRIHMAENPSRELSAALGHELVHALLGEGWSTLPPVAEEGLADWIQEVLHPEFAASMRADHLAKASAAFGGMRFGLWCPGSVQGGRRLASFTFPGPSPGEVPITDPQLAIDQGGQQADDSSVWKPYEVSVSDPRLYGIGYLAVVRAVERVGLSGLYELCQRAADQGLEQMPGAWLLEAGGLSRSPDEWQQIIAERVGRRELTALGHSLSPFMVDLISRGLLSSGHQLDVDDFLARYRPRLGLEQGRSRLPLTWLPKLRGVHDDSSRRRRHPGPPQDVGIAVP
ncbi:MAG: hypothetical protein ACI9EF_001623 [Pseudohongiellaceae bacterium]|jgi:hypothetical protein